MDVTKVILEAEGIVSLELRDKQGAKLPAWMPGAHLDLVTGAYSRKYSLCGDPRDSFMYRIAVLREDLGRGGSLFVHQTIRPGETVHIRGPRNHFRLDETAGRYTLIAGGIGITPIIAMADRLRELGKDYELHYCGRSFATMAFVERLRRDHAARLHLYPSHEGIRLDLSHLLGHVAPSAQVYACGPTRLLDAVGKYFGGTSGRLRVEHFQAAPAIVDRSNDQAFDVELADSGLTLSVQPQETLLQALTAAGVDLPSDCGEGLCGTCEVGVLSGEIDHRDVVLTLEERSRGDRMIVCCSRGNGKIVVAL